MSDPRPYHGPIESADGRRPYNRYLWPTRFWWACDAGGPLRPLHGPSWSIEFVHLADGRFATGGFVHEIEWDRTAYGDRCCFPTRDAAIRAQAARLIRRARRALRAPPNMWGEKEINLERAEALVQWARRIVAEEMGQAEPVAVSLHRLAPPPPPPPPGQLDIESWLKEHAA